MEFCDIERHSKLVGLFTTALQVYYNRNGIQYLPEVFRRRKVRISDPKQQRIIDNLPFQVVDLAVVQRDRFILLDDKGIVHYHRNGRLTKLSTSDSVIRIFHAIVAGTDVIFHISTNLAVEYTCFVDRYVHVTPLDDYQVSFCAGGAMIHGNGKQFYSDQ